MEQSTVSKKQTAYAMTIGPLGALAMKADKVLLDLYLAILIVIALFGYLAVQAFLEKKPPTTQQEACDES